MTGIQRLNPGLAGEIRSACLDANTPPDFRAFIATRNDLGDIIALATRSFGDEMSVDEMYDYYLRRGHALIFGLRHGDTLCAYTILEFNRRQKRIYSVELATDERFRGRGLGLWILQRAEDIGRFLGYASLTSHTKPGDIPAIRMNEKAGLKIVRTIPGYYDSGDDALYMKKIISPATGAAS